MIDDLLQQVDPEAIVFDGLDEAVIGTDHRGYLVYDYLRMLNVFLRDMGEEEAVEWIDYNVLGTMGGAGFTVLYSSEPIQNQVQQG